MPPDVKPAKKLSIAFLWHMHQPCYKDTITGRYYMPWARFHAIKDYFPMAALLEDFDNIRMTFNLVPSLLEQIHDYAHNDATDALLDLTRKKASSLTEDDKLDILENFFRVNFKNFIEPNERYSELLMKKGLANVSDRAMKKIAAKFSAQDFLDLQVFFNMAWFHSISIDKDKNLKDLSKKCGAYTEDDKAYVILKQKEIIGNIIPLYKKLQDAGRIEISATPFYHPITPLICDTSIAKISMPGAPLPKNRFQHPEDAAWHIKEAISYHADIFGTPPRGMWPSEGSVSDEALGIMAANGIKWAATDEDILFRSIAMSDKKQKAHHHADRRIIYQPYKFSKGSKSLSVVFRDKNLSDIISFNYNAWDQSEAAADLIGHFKNISASLANETQRRMVVIAMDGENAWEYFHDNGREFFQALYSSLDNDKDLEATTISGHLGIEPPDKSLDTIFPASWINHNFRIWIGEEQDNLSWDYLSAVRKDLVKFTKQMKKNPGNEDALEKAWREFYIAEGSDWNWWYGGRAHSGSDNPFDKLYRTHLKNIYKFLKKPVPDFLKISIA
ncbi:MAG: glycoside hydrolase family 57 protein [Candidatus Omnitrophota bacterium]|nr:glycoside hydrolase family 57 protein [Candidatus Omnitrophota bacterium]